MVEYLRAAQSAITGLENEVDEIFIEAKMLALFYWDRRDRDNRDKMTGLFERVDQYLNRDRLRPLLDQAIQGTHKCYDFAKADVEGFLQGSQKKETVKEVRRLLDELCRYLDALGSAMNYSRENYAGPSGIDKEELLGIQPRIRELVQSEPDELRARELAEFVENFQKNQRNRAGLSIVAHASRIIQELIVVFRLVTRSEPAAT